LALSLILTTASVARADQLIGTYQVNYRFNAVGCVNPHVCGPGAIHVTGLAPGRYRVVRTSVMNPGDDAGGAVMWVGTASAGTSYALSQGPFVIDLQPGQTISFFYIDPFPDDNSPGIGSVIELYALSDIPPPTHIQATQIGTSGTQVRLSWEYNDPSIDGFVIEAKLPSGTWSMLSTPAADQRNFTDRTLPPFTTVSYRLRAYRNEDYSDYSEVATSFQLYVATQNCGIGAGSEPCTPLRAWSGGLTADNSIVSVFGPDPTSQLTLDDVAGQFGFDHFNWVSAVMHLPSSVVDILDWQGNRPIAPFIDPPLGGYLYRLSDFLPFYWNEQPGYEPDYFLTANVSGDNRQLQFADRPWTPIPLQSDYIQFVTVLVGVNGPIGSVSTSEALAALVWNTNGHINGPSRLGNLELPSSPTDGGIISARIAVIAQLPDEVRQLLIKAGLSGVPNIGQADTNAPVTAAALKGLEGQPGWFKGPVEVTLIATDINGPSDIANTTYQIDGGAPIGYRDPFLIIGDGIHYVTYASADASGNADEPITRNIAIDSLKPSISCAAANDTLWPPNGKPVPVTIRCRAIDSLSGIASGSFRYAVIDEYGESQPSSAIQVDPSGSFAIKLLLNAARNGEDRDGRAYTVVVQGNDQAGNQATYATTLTVAHDRRYQ